MTRKMFFQWVPLSSLCAYAAQIPAVAAELVTLTASDGVRVYGQYYAALGKEKVTILLFHQAGSNAGEYAAIAPRLTQAGYSCLAIDQRLGGTRWGRANRTAQSAGDEADYRKALPDLEAALSWARSKHPSGRIVVWGSSYSAALAFLLAAEHKGEVSAVLAFSPGEYLRDKHAVRDAAARVDVPVFVTSAQDSEEITSAREILAQVPARGEPRSNVQFVPRQGGVHGSSTLLADANRRGAESVWKAVLNFLSDVPRPIQK